MFADIMTASVSVWYFVSKSNCFCGNTNRVTSLTMADGVFTPAVSVTSAVGGIGVAKPSVIKDIIPISIVGVQPIIRIDVNRPT